PHTDFERFTLITDAFLAVGEQSDAARATDLVHRALAVEEHGYYESVMRASVGRPMPSFILTLLERFDESRETLDGLGRRARDPRRGRARGARLRGPFGRRGVPRRASVGPVPRGQRGGCRGRRVRGA